LGLAIMAAQEGLDKIDMAPMIHSSSSKVLDTELAVMET